MSQNETLSYSHYTATAKRGKIQQQQTEVC